MMPTASRAAAISSWTSDIHRVISAASGAKSRQRVAWRRLPEGAKFGLGARGGEGRKRNQRPPADNGRGAARRWAAPGALAKPSMQKQLWCNGAASASVDRRSDALDHRPNTALVQPARPSRPQQPSHPGVSRYPLPFCDNTLSCRGPADKTSPTRPHCVYQPPTHLPSASPGGNLMGIHARCRPWGSSMAGPKFETAVFPARCWAMFRVSGLAVWPTFFEVPHRSERAPPTHTHPTISLEATTEFRTRPPPARSLRPLPQPQPQRHPEGQRTRGTHRGHGTATNASERSFAVCVSPA